MRKALFIIIFLIIIINDYAVSPHPRYKNYNYLKEHKIFNHIIKKGDKSKVKSLPNSVLAIRVAFNDIDFDLVADEPDSLAHDKAYFERLLFHMKSYWEDASHDQYSFNYEVWDEVLYLNKNMSYYGEDRDEGERSSELLNDIIIALDPQIDFSNYDAFIIFHAGAGQETDLEELNTDLIWSTFVNRADLQETFDPENDDYEGISTQDGVIISEASIVPETTWQDYFPEGDASYKYGLLGLLCHEFGHSLGLPTLFDNVSSNGRSQGIGDFGIMGTGSWVANGYVPPLPCAWSRVFLGWETPITITQNSFNQEIAYALSKDNDNRVYKIVISEKEYFLLENRQQNIDGSSEKWMKIDPETNEPVFDVEKPSFTFKYLSDEEQKYYPYPNNTIPKFDFMTNTYKGCEWDFYLPNYDYTTQQTIDGSGILIWHIDENVIDDNFTPDLTLNTINNDAFHKGIDLEEADGYQNLDSPIQTYYFTGSPYDAYREGNKAYFGHEINPFDGSLSLPTSESYYGGISLEIFDISASNLQMSFSVKFKWKLDSSFVGESKLPLCLIDFDNDGYKNDFIFPQENGRILEWNLNGDAINSYEYTLNSEIKKLYVYDEEENVFYFPLKNNNDILMLKKFYCDGNTEYSLILEGYDWANPPMIYNDKTNKFVVCGFNSAEDSKINLINTNNNDEILEIDVADSICTNFASNDECLWWISKSENSYSLNKYIVGENVSSEELAFDFGNIHSFHVIQEDIESSKVQFLILAENKVYMFDEDLTIRDGFPVTLPLDYVSYPTFADLDNNGRLDIIIGSENNYFVVGYNGDILNEPIVTISSPDSLQISSGVVPFDIDLDGKMELIGNMSKNRLYCWDNSFRVKNGFPQTFGSRSRNFPIFSKNNNDSLFVYIGSDNGTVYRNVVSENYNVELINNVVELQNLRRTAFYKAENLENIYETSDLFVDGKLFFFPNPYNSVFGNNYIFLNIMLNKDENVELDIYDLAGNKIIHKRALCYAYLDNKNKFKIDVNELSSGVYFAVIKAGGKSKKLKFAIEK